MAALLHRSPKDRNPVVHAVEGGSEQPGFLQDAKLKLVDGSYLFPQPLAQLFPGIEVHYGFTGDLSTAPLYTPRLLNLLLSWTPLRIMAAQWSHTTPGV